jgi:hypothetical protein
MVMRYDIGEQQSRLEVDKGEPRQSRTYPNLETTTLAFHLRIIELALSVVDTMLQPMPNAFLTGNSQRWLR